MNNQKDNLLQLYIISELAYIQHFENQNINQDLLFPSQWYESKNYKLKIEIIAESIKNNTLIEFTPKYQDFIEGVKTYKKEKD